jgi:hypothetical protein
MKFNESILRCGGRWLGAARHWIQCNRLNGSSVTWGSSDPLSPPITANEVELIASKVAIALINELHSRGYLTPQFENDVKSFGNIIL